MKRLTIAFALLGVLALSALAAPSKAHDNCIDHISGEWTLTGCIDHDRGAVTWTATNGEGIILIWENDAWVEHLPPSNPTADTAAPSTQDPSYEPVAGSSESGGRYYLAEQRGLREDWYTKIWNNSVEVVCWKGTTLVYLGFGNRQYASGFWPIQGVRSISYRVDGGSIRTASGRTEYGSSDLLLSDSQGFLDLIRFGRALEIEYSPTAIREVDLQELFGYPVQGNIDRCGDY